MEKTETNTESNSDAKPADDKKEPVARKDEQRTFGAPGIERQK